MEIIFQDLKQGVCKIDMSIMADVDIYECGKRDGGVGKGISDQKWIDYLMKTYPFTKVTDIDEVKRIAKLTNTPKESLVQLTNK